MKKIIEVCSLAKKYGSFTAVDSISFDVLRGEVFGFLGPNGAGKSTTINMLCTTLRVTSGTAVINGFDVVKQKARVRENIGIIFQDPSLDDKLTAAENLNLHCVIYKVPKKIRQERIRNVLQMVELWDRKDSMVRTFSGGMKRRLEIARGLLHHPNVLFLDEPTIGLDPQTRAHIWKYIMDLKESKGITIFMTTHYMEEAEYCDRLAIIDHGAIVALDTPASLKKAVGGDVIKLKTADDDTAISEIDLQYGLQAVTTGDGIFFQVADGEAFLAPFIKKFPVPVLSINMSRPTLNDVFLKITGKSIRDEGVSSTDIWKNNMRSHMRGQ